MNKVKILTRSLWVYHVAGATCNNCDIEILDCLTPRFDVERFGIKLVGSVRHADLLLVAGIQNRKNAPRLKELYSMAPKPVAVMAFGNCAASQGMFTQSYNRSLPVDQIIPVDIYVPGCPPRPEAIIDAALKLIKKLQGA